MGLIDSKGINGSSDAGATHDEQPARRRRIPFSEVRAGMTGRVVAIRSATAEARRLQEMGLSIGAEFTVLELAPFGDPVQISLRGYRLCLRRREARCVDVEIISEAGECRSS